MMLLTATPPATVYGPAFLIERDMVERSRIVRSRRSRRDLICFPSLDCDPTRSIFCSPVANLLETRRGGSHYSVIDALAATALVAGLAGCHLLIDEVSASHGRGDSAGAQAQAGESHPSTSIGPLIASDRRKKDLCKFSRFCLQYARRQHDRGYRNDANRRKHSRDLSPVRYGCTHLA